MATQPIEYEPSVSKTGEKLVPAFSVFQTPPEAAARNQRCGLVGSTAMSTIRPDVRAGPIDRRARPDHVSLDQPPFFSGFSSALGAGFLSAGLSGTARTRVDDASSDRTKHERSFTVVSILLTAGANPRVSVGLRARPATRAGRPRCRPLPPRRRSSGTSPRRRPLPRP